MSDKDIVEEARALLNTLTTSWRFKDAAEPLLRALADEVETLRKENKQLKTCDHCERFATQTVCDLHEGR